VPEAVTVSPTAAEVLFNNRLISVDTLAIEIEGTHNINSIKTTWRHAIILNFISYHPPTISGLSGPAKKS
jgi:hypothetical protein